MPNINLQTFIKTVEIVFGSKSIKLDLFIVVFIMLMT